MHIVATVDGKVASDETVNPTALPKEVLLTGTTGAKVEVTATALTSQAATRGPGGTPTTPVVLRRAASYLVPNAKKLLRMQLETRCATFSAEVRAR